jgi:hypothetical protein
MITVVHCWNCGKLLDIYSVSKADLPYIHTICKDCALARDI